jgi:hypothetical protein
MPLVEAFGRVLTKAKAMVRPVDDVNHGHCETVFGSACMTLRRASVHCSFLAN